MIDKRIVNDLINFINNQTPSVTNDLQIGFDLLDTNRNSICFSYPDENIGEDTFNDVTGQFKQGYIILSLYFRDISGVEGENDLNAYDFLNNIADFIKKNYTYKVINEEQAEWVEQIIITSKAKMVKLYEGNVKDYETRLRLNYVYKV